MALLFQWLTNLQKFRGTSQRVEDLVWYYPEPIAATEKIKGHLCFFNEKVDLEVDGEAQERPQTQWS